MRTVRMEEMNWPDIQEAIKSGCTTAVLAIGSTEQHGPHLPLITDTLIGDALALKVAERLGNALQAPTIRVGLSEHHLAFPGTVTFRPDTLKAVIGDYVESLIKHGFKTIILLPTHGGNFGTTRKAADELQQKHPDLKIIGLTDLFGLMNALAKFSEDYGISESESGAHAGESETSLILALAGSLVRKDRYAPGYLGTLGEKEIKIIFEKGMPVLTNNGILGDPTRSSAEKGDVYLERWTEYVIGETRKLL